MSFYSKRRRKASYAVFLCNRV